MSRAFESSSPHLHSNPWHALGDNVTRVDPPQFLVWKSITPKIKGISLGLRKRIVDANEAGEISKNWSDHDYERAMLSFHYTNARETSSGKCSVTFNHMIIKHTLRKGGVTFQFRKVMLMENNKHLHFLWSWLMSGVSSYDSESTKLQPSGGSWQCFL